jgi:heptosyltransferase II
MKVLVVQNRMGIGDLIIFLPYIYSISKEYNTPISLLVKENTRAKDILKDTPYIDEIIILDRDDKNKTGRHQGATGVINLIQDLRKRNFTKSFIFNSSARYALIAKLAGIKNRYQYPLFNKKNQNIVETAKNFINNSIKKNIESNPSIEIDNNKIMEAKKKYVFSEEYYHILLGVGGSGPTKRIPVEKFIKFMEMISKNKKCKFYLAAGKNKIEHEIINKIIESEHKKNCISLGLMNISETLPIIKNCNLAVSNDTSFSHIAAALGVKTIVLMSDTPLLYGSYSPKMFPIIPDGENNVTHNTLGKERINPIKIYEKAKQILKL